MISMKVFFLAFMLFADGQVVYQATPMKDLDECRIRMTEQVAIAERSRNVLGHKFECLSYVLPKEPT